MAALRRKNRPCAIGTEVPEVSTQFVRGGKNTHSCKEARRHGSDDALSSRAFFVSIGDRELALLAHPPMRRCSNFCRSPRVQVAITLPLISVIRRWLPRKVAARARHSPWRCSADATPMPLEDLVSRAAHLLIRAGRRLITMPSLPYVSFSDAAASARSETRLTPAGIASGPERMVG